MSTPDGGPAFPKQTFYKRREMPDGAEKFEMVEPSTTGMSLRDWFAGQALTDILWGEPFDEEAKVVATKAYLLADAMLAARRKP